MRHLKQYSSVGITALVLYLVAGGVAWKLANMPPLAFAGVAVGIYLLFAIKVVDQWEKVAVLRFGRYRGLRGPGVFLVIPVIDG